MKSRRFIGKALLCVVLSSLSLWCGFTNTAEAATVSAKISSDKVEKGKTIKITSKTEGVTYKSSDTQVAYVNQNGVIVGKKKGKATITVMKDGYDSKSFPIAVTTNGKTPNIYVWYEEINLADEQLTDGVYTAVVKNSSKAALDKVEYIYTAKVETETIVTPQEEATTDGLTDPNTSDTTNQAEDNNQVINNRAEDNNQSEMQDNQSNIPVTPTPKAAITTSSITLKATAKNIPANGKKAIKIEVPDGGKIISLQLEKINVTTKSALIIYNVKSGKYTYQWATKDKTAPVISGLVGENSYFGDTVFMTIYPNIEYDFTKYVSVEDDRDTKVKLSVDTSKVNFKKEGDYTITFTATDSAGNKATADAKVHVRIPKKIDKMADELLKEIVKDNMTEQEKLTAVYTYIRKNITYVGNYDEDNWEAAAEYAMKYKSGDCFAYYSLSRLLLTRLGVPNMMITRYRGKGNHWWNLVYIEGGWYHYDTTPRTEMATFCLVTSEQLEEYSNKAGNSHIWDVTKYPKTATKKISKVVWGKRY